MSHLRHHSKLLTALLAATAGVLVAACSSGSGAATGTSGGTVTFAESPGNAPNYISPLTAGPYYTVSNSSDFS